MSKKKVLICGTDGFIGRNIFETLSEREGLDVWGSYYKEKPFNNPQLLRADLTKKEDIEALLKRSKIDVIVQAAAATSGAKDIVTRPYLHVTDNVIMNALLYQAAYDFSIPQVVFFSCTVMYPLVDKPVRETDLDLNQELYKTYFGVGWMKIYVEKLCQFYSRLGRTKFTVIRHSNIYGPYDKYDLEKSHVFGATITKVMTTNGKIVVWGEGKEERDLLYISDLVDFVEKVIEGQDYDFDIFNVGLGKAVSVGDLVQKIVDISGRNLTMEYDKTKPTIPTKLVLDITKAKQRFNWSPKVSIEEGIKKTLAWYKENIIT